MSDRMYYSREAEERALQQRTAMAVAVLVMGLGIGAILALLFAPRSGEEVRKSIGKQVDGVYDSGRHSTGSALDTLRKEFDRLRSDVEDRLKNLT